MPYIPLDEREQLDPLINALAQQIVAQARAHGHDGAFAGLLNYTCTRLSAKILQMNFGGMRYHQIATITGIFHNVADEFYRRIAVPYEDAQITKNGDVDVYQAYLDGGKASLEEGKEVSR